MALPCSWPYIVFPELADRRVLAELEAYCEITGQREVRDAWLNLLETSVPRSSCM